MPSVDDLRRQLQRLAVQALPLDVLWQRTNLLLKRVVPWDVSAWGQVDPATLLSTGCLVLGVPYDPVREREIFALEHHKEEVNRLIDLVHRQPPAGGLVHETCGQPERSPRYQRILQPLGIVDDVRVALMRDGVCWASLYAYRRDVPFSAREVAILGALAGDLADGVRLALLRADAEAASHPEAPGLLLLSQDGSVSAASEVAERWMRVLAPDGNVPPAVTALATSLQSGTPGPQRVRVRVSDGRWLVLHASEIGAGAAVIVELARPVEVAEVLCAAYGLSSRERDVVGLVLRGENNRSTARVLGISEHTVKEHLKSVFAKVGVLSRSELAARLLHEQYLPRRNAGIPASAAGWFRESA